MADTSTLITNLQNTASNTWTAITNNQTVQNAVSTVKSVIKTGAEKLGLTSDVNATTTTASKGVTNAQPASAADLEIAYGQIQTDTTMHKALDFSKLDFLIIFFN